MNMMQQVQKLIVGLPQPMVEDDNTFPQKVSLMVDSINSYIAWDFSILQGKITTDIGFCVEHTSSSGQKTALRYKVDCIPPVVEPVSEAEEMIHKDILPRGSRSGSGEKEFFCEKVSEAATQALVNLSQITDLASKMIETDIIKVTMDLLYKPGCELTELLVMLLVNLTKVNTGVESLLQDRKEANSDVFGRRNEAEFEAEV
ncbi:hypothetical protein LXL04_017020 [Taraxacum kok-saghyz]